MFYRMQNDQTDFSIMPCQVDFKKVVLYYIKCLIQIASVDVYVRHGGFYQIIRLSQNDMHIRFIWNTENTILLCKIEFHLWKK